jgi:GWxTD domain-containing protein
MTLRRLLTAAVVIAAAAHALALAPQHEAWGNSAVSFLFTDEEVAAWKAVRTDEEAQAFQDLFWARRDPTPATPKNEFRESIEARIRYADEKFTPSRKKTPGSLTERGQMLIVFGQPHRMAQQDAAQQMGAGAAGRIGIEAPRTGDSSLGNVRSAVAGRLNTYQVWLYEGEHVRQLFGVPRAEFTFVDRTNTQEYGLERGGPIDVASWRRKVAASYITQPHLTRAPQFTTVPMAGAAISAAPVAVMTSLTTPALASAVAEVKAASANPYADRAYASYGEFVTSDGEYFVPVLLYVPKSSPAAAEQNLTFFGVIEDASGKSVLAFEEPAKLIASKDDFYVDKALTLPAGKHRATSASLRTGRPSRSYPPTCSSRDRSTRPPRDSHR